MKIKSSTKKKNRLRVASVAKRRRRTKGCKEIMLRLYFGYVLSLSFDYVEVIFVIYLAYVPTERKEKKAQIEVGWPRNKHQS